MWIGSQVDICLSSSRGFQVESEFAKFANLAKQDKLSRSVFSCSVNWGWSPRGMTRLEEEFNSCWVGGFGVWLWRIVEVS